MINQTGQTVQGVYCDAHNCSYNDCNNNVCVASKINVGTQAATTTGETLCSTFKLK